MSLISMNAAFAANVPYFEVSVQRSRSKKFSKGVKIHRYAIWPMTCQCANNCTHTVESQISVLHMHKVTIWERCQLQLLNIGGLVDFKNLITMCLPKYSKLTFGFLKVPKFDGTTRSSSNNNNFCCIKGDRFHCTRMAWQALNNHPNNQTYFLSNF